jgi:hypothetical protein
MSLPVLLLLTSEQCGHCARIRSHSKGIICPSLKKGSTAADYKKINGFDPPPISFLPSHKFDVDFCRDMITAGKGPLPKFRLMLVHLATMANSWSQNGVVEISIIQLIDEGIIQTVFKPSPEGTIHESYKITTKVENLFPKPRIDKVDWTTTVKVNIPIGIIEYCYFFPALLAFSGEQWNQCLSKNVPIYGVVNGIGTIQRLPFGSDKLQPDGTPKQVTVMSYAAFVAKIESGETSLEIPPDAMVAAPPTPPSTPSAPAGTKSAKVCTGQVLKLKPATRW